MAFIFICSTTAIDLATTRSPGREVERALGATPLAALPASADPDPALVVPLFARFGNGKIGRADDALLVLATARGSPARDVGRSFGGVRGVGAMLPAAGALELTANFGRFSAPGLVAGALLPAPGFPLPACVVGVLPLAPGALLLVPDSGALLRGAPAPGNLAGAAMAGGAGGAGAAGFALPVGAPTCSIFVGFAPAPGNLAGAAMAGGAGAAGFALPVGAPACSIFVRFVFDIDIDEDGVLMKLMKLKLMMMGWDGVLDAGAHGGRFVLIEVDAVGLASLRTF